MFPYLEKFLQVLEKKRNPNDEMMDLLVADALACEAFSRSVAWWVTKS